ncbi:MAG: exodeoxyribonuclease III, partial [Sphingomonas hengshuiensis]
ARLYTWWSYRAKDWQASDRGRRLDHMWATADVAAKATMHLVVEAARSWDKPSDHIPLVTEFAL